MIFGVFLYGWNPVRCGISDIMPCTCKPGRLTISEWFFVGSDTWGIPNLVANIHHQGMNILYKKSSVHAIDELYALLWYQYFIPYNPPFLPFAVFLCIYWVRNCVPMWSMIPRNYRQTSKIRRKLVGNKLVDHSDVVGTSHVGVAPTTPLST